MRKKQKKRLGFGILSLMIVISLLLLSEYVQAEPNYVETVEGNGFYCSTGEAYPSHIQITGYNSKDSNTLYLNLEFTTSKSVSSNIQFYYRVEIFSGDGVLLGNAGTIDSSLVAQASFVQPPTSYAAAQVQNLPVNLGSNQLPANHRIVVTVQNTIIDSP